MPTARQLVHRQRRAAVLDLVADVLVIGGGPAASWAAVTATEAGARVILVDKGYVGTSGATAPANTGTWFVPPGAAREAAILQRQARTGGLAELRWVDRTLDMAWQRLHVLAHWGYKFPNDDTGKPYLANLRGRNFFRQAPTLLQSLDRLDRTWIELRDHLPGEGLGAVKSREAAALTASGRWAYASALARAESRGMHRRLDLPQADPEFLCAFEVSGLDRINVTRSGISRGPAL